VLEGKRIGVVVPAYDEEAHIVDTILRVPTLVDAIVVVDDASRDRTAEKVQWAMQRDSALRDRLTFVRHRENRGVGAAIVTGYRRALDLGVDVLVVMAGDGQMDPADLPSLVAPILSGRADYTKGDRFSHPDLRGSMPQERQIVGRALSLLTARAAGLDRLSDSQSGYTAISREALLRLNLDMIWPRYGYPNDLIGLLAGIGQRIDDVPVRPIYLGQKSGLRPWHLATIGFLIARVAARRVLKNRDERRQNPR
jgi:glycosyltransferase involved in cell wall biosynthesis